MSLRALVLGVVLLATPAIAQEGPAANEGLDMALVTAKLARGAQIGGLLNIRTATTADTLVLLFPGSPGLLRFEPEAGAVVRTLAGNTLVRARRHLTQQGVATLLVDCPNDQWEKGCKADYRHSPQHAEDIAALVAAVRAVQAFARVYAVGHSYGTVSTSYLARTLPDLAGAAHLSTMGGTSNSARASLMADTNWQAAKIPQLFVHHRDDRCGATPYSAIRGRIGNLPLVTVTGLSPDARGPECEARGAHGLAGRERETMIAIRSWIDTGSAPSEIP
jgi:pimeloyl-ACP methyl ester carboxylesterase